YYSKPTGELELLKTPGVDTGMGLERLAMVSQSKQAIFETDLFQPFSDLLPLRMSKQTKRILADHARAIAFLINDGVLPSNKDAGYILRRLIRRYIVRMQGSSAHDYLTLLGALIEYYKNPYKDLDQEKIFATFQDELSKFEKTLAKGISELKKSKTLTAVSAFKLYESYGLPYEVIKDLGQDKAEQLTREDFDREFAKHQEISRAGQTKKFGGHGLLLDTGELKAANEEEVKIVTRLHTATHLLQASLRKVLGEGVHQAGSDITAERTRFDFTFGRKLAPEEIKEIERVLNEAISRDLRVEWKEMDFEEAKASGALYSPREKYPSRVKVYSAFDEKTGEVFSKELCGGPHVLHTKEVGKVAILKEEAVSSGIRRIRAALVP
ncbi:MAG: alanine--tRNA ligase, partial [Candidatus Wildermuthbacteria bacterium]|nr:alanine--tRNA ligase [Candidatus Wildermuthbacteria bacterium]